MNYDEAISYINSFTKSGAPVHDLSRFKALAERLKNPQDKLKFIHVAGTNGKGSVSEYVAEGLRLAGCKTGKFTSPYINRVEERFQLDGENISGEKLAELCGIVKAAADETGEKNYSQFEIHTAIAFLFYLEEKADYVVLEVGIGGDLDCTNIITPEISVITTVDLDHCAILGNTPAEIAAHKAGIIKNGRPIVLAPFQHREVTDVISRRAAEMTAPLVAVDGGSIKITASSLFGTEFTYKNRPYSTRMGGEHQAGNAAAAIETLRLLNIGDEFICGALKSVLPARLELMCENPLTVVDGGHNLSGAAAAALLLKTAPQSKTIIIGMLKSKDFEHVLPVLLPLAKKIIAVDFFDVNALPASRICEIAASLGIEAAMAESPADALTEALRSGNEMTAVCGSLYLAGTMRAEIVRSLPTLVPAGENDIPLLRELSDRAFYADFVKYGECPGYNRSYESFRESFRTTEKYFFRVNGEITGSVSLRHEEDGSCYIGSLVIPPEFQNRRIGQNALAQLPRLCPDARRFYLKTPADSERNIHFYEKCGFEIADSFMDGNVRVVWLEKTTGGIHND